MEPTASPAPLRLPASGTPRLVLAISAAGAVVTLCWAALQVRAARDELRLAKENAPPALVPAVIEGPGLNARVTELEHLLTEEKSRREQAAGSAAARIAELEKVIAFLRLETEAAQKTIERLSGLEHAASPEIQPVQTNTLNKSRDR